MKKEEIVELKYKDYAARILVGRGANCISLRNQKYHAKILREPTESVEWDNPYLYGMPILFPVNRIENGRFEFEGRTYSFPINEPGTGCHLHGELHRMPFQIEKQSPDMVICSYRAEEEKGYLNFPHAFEIKIKYRLSDTGLCHEIDIKNCSSRNMPVLLGFHTTFCADFTGDGERERIKVLAEISEEYERNMTTYLPTGITPVFDEVSQKLSEGNFCPFGTPISRHYKCGNTGKMVLYDEKNKLSVVYENDANYPFRLIYNGNADEYICLEPQNCKVNCQEGFDFVRPGETKTYISRIYLTEGDAR